MPHITYKSCYYLFILLPTKGCNFHMQVFQIKLKYHCSKPIKLQKLLMQQYKYIIKEKNAFLSYKNKKSKSRKIDRFPKRLTHGFGSKLAIFPTFFLGNIGQENIFYDILRLKNAFLGYKNKKFKKSKNRHFSKGVNPWFWSKNGLISPFFLGNIGEEKVFYDILRQKKVSLGYKKKKFKKSKN